MIIMKLTFKNKRSEEEILNSEYSKKNKLVTPETLPNKLFKGNNFDVLQILIHEYKLKSKVDLIYIDPPFATNNIFKMGESTISNPNNGKIAYQDVLTEDSYLKFIHERLILLKELMSDKASIYFHIDDKQSHYIKILMDEIFGRENFRRDITRIKCNPKNFRQKNYGNMKDVILFYTKTENYIWNKPTIPFTKEEIEKKYNKIDNNGDRYTTVPLHAPGETQNGTTGSEWRGILPPKGRHWRCNPKILDQLDSENKIEWSSTGNPRKKNYAKDMKQNGKKMQDVWEYKDPSKPLYPTQKNLNMLKKIIATSTNTNSIVLDCFAGSGTTLLAAQELNRKWIGVDNSEQAINVIKKRLNLNNILPF